MDSNCQISMSSRALTNEACVPPRKKHIYRNHLRSHMNFECLEHIFNDKLFCDIILVAEGVEIAVHKMLLACCSEWFYWKFRELGESNRIEIENIPYETLSTVVSFMYTSEVVINVENVKDILGAANMFAMRDLQDACCDFLLGDLNSKNCLRTKNVASRYKCQELVQLTDDYIRTHFSELILDDEFLHMNYDLLLDLVSKEMSCTVEYLLDFLISWVRHDLEHRKVYFRTLIKHVELALMPQRDVLRRIEREEWLKCDSQIMLDIFKMYTLSQTVSVQSSKVLVVFGITEEMKSGMEIYDFQKKIWLKGPQVVEIECDMSPKVVFNGTTIYLIEKNKMKSIELKRNPADMIWSPCNMLEERTDWSGCVVLKNAFYVVGGLYIADARRFDFSTGRWQSIKSMSQARGCVGLCAFLGKLFAIGGVTEAGHSNMVECYSPESDSWQKMPAMSIERLYPGVGVLGDTLYVVGGINNRRRCKQVESFNHIQHTWSQLPDLNIARSSPAVIAVDDQLYVIGGHSDNKSVEVYDPKSNTWSIMPSLMNTGKKIAAAALIDKSRIKFLDSTE